MLPKSLKFKVGLYLTIALSMLMLAFVAVIAKHQRDEMIAAVTTHATQISEIVAKSTRNAMLRKQRKLVREIVADIGRQEGLERIRVMSKDRVVASSADPEEIGTDLGVQSAPCLPCHRSNPPVGELRDDQRWRTYRSPDGREMLVSIEAVRNEPSCVAASCHDPLAERSVLGVVEVTYSLARINRSMGEHFLMVVGISGAFILFVAAGVALLLHRLIYLPLGDLASGALRISGGYLDHKIPVRGDDEFGRVAASFNSMTRRLRETREELDELIATLERKVQERTQELRIAQAGVIQGEKLAAVGQLAAGIAHELNNPLTGVLTFTQLLRKKMPEGSQDADDLDLVIRETKRCASIIRRLLDFAREKAPENEPVDVNRVVAETVRLIDHAAAVQKIEVRQELDPALPSLMVDADLIKQVIMNMLVNSQQAIVENGRITITTRLHQDARWCDALAAALPLVEIAVTDTGCGIPQENLQRVFDPFFTSKEVGKGTGLGLSVSYGIVKSYGGEIKVESVVGQGTTFHVCLPVKPAARVGAAHSAPAGNIP